MTLLQSLLNATAACAPSALLLWLAASLAMQARRDQVAWDRRLRVIAVGVAAAGVWWPLEQAAATSAIGGASGLAWQLALVGLSVALPLVAGVAATSAGRWTSGRRVGAAAAALLLSVLCITAVSSGTGASAAGVLLRSALGATVLSAALVWLATPTTELRYAGQLRLAMAAAAAAALAFAPTPLRSAADSWAHPALLPTLALALLGIGLLGLVRERQPLARVSARLPAESIEPLGGRADAAADTHALRSPTRRRSGAL